MTDALPEVETAEHAAAEKPKRTRKKKEPEMDVFDEAIAAQQARQEFQAGHHEPHQDGERAKPEEHEHTGNGHAEHRGESHAARHEDKKPWIQKFGHWRNNDAGVRLEEDRRHGLASIVTRDPLPEKALEILEQRGFAEDPEVGGYSKKIDRWRPSDSRDGALETAKDVANVVLAEKGLPELKSSYVSRS